MQVKVRRVGNSISVTIPKAVAAELALDENTQMNVIVRDGAVVMEPAVSRWDRLVDDARARAAERGLIERDVTEAVSEIRGRRSQ
ncbi:MAG: AbrB/MazE/SpoVT family DNA-binding domain-containing protein [Actinobacteria bacterium]|nr:AbrB/MazE/SpoVT family DNA-binding domain-containing protein [Actinomycetota bacterium]